MEHSFFADEEGIWWLDNQIVPRELRLMVDDRLNPTTVTMLSNSNINAVVLLNNVKITDLKDRKGDNYPDWSYFKSYINGFFRNV